MIDADHPPLERWAGMRDAEVARRLGRPPRRLAGRHDRHRVARRSPRHGVIPADGPEQWTSGTLFPRASKKIARAINAASGRRPLVVLANLAGFDGSPESMREWQLEFGAEIGRAVVNFDGPIVFCVVSRYHGGAFVVFSQRLNEELEAVALEGAHASVIGGAPAAAVVFARDVEQAARQRRRASSRSTSASQRAEGAERQRLRAERAALWDAVLSEKRGEFAARVRRRAQRRARGAHGLGQPHHRARGAAAVPRRRGRARDAPDARPPRPAMTAPGWLTAAQADVPARKFRRRRALR